MRPGCKAPTSSQLSAHPRHAGPLSCPALCLGSSPWPCPARFSPVNLFFRRDQILVLWPWVPFLRRIVISGTGPLAHRFLFHLPCRPGGSLSAQLQPQLPVLTGEQELGGCIQPTPGVAHAPDSLCGSDGPRT